MASGSGARTVSPTLRAALARAVGEEHLLLDPDLTAAYETDWTGRFSGRASCVVRPATTGEVADVLRACSAARLPVVPQGGNTGLVGGSVPRDGEAVLSTTRLRGTCLVDRAAAEILAPAGATLREVQQAARDAGFDFGVDIAPRDSCSIGGLIATNAGGVHVLRHGMMVDQVIGVEAVLADGGVVGRVPALRKDNAGYHLGSLLAGSEGTLAIITRAHLRLVPALPARAVALLGLTDLESVVTTVEHLRPLLPSLSALELVSAACVDLVIRHTGLAAPFDDPPPVVLLVECAGRSDVLGELASALTACGDLVRSSAVADDAAGMRRLWRYREDVSAAINAVGVPHKLDVAVPMRAIPRFVAALTERIAMLAPAARLALFGHVGDGNLHVNLLGLGDDDERLDEAVLALVVAEGGSIASEHGLGRAKARYLELVRNERERAALAALKRALDPDGILNPGVVLA